MRQDVYESITNQIIAELEAGAPPWLQPWSSPHMAGRVALPLRHNGVPYRGVNVISLWMQALANGFTSAIWMTFKQAAEIGGHIRKGEKGSLVVYANALTRNETNEISGDEVTREIHYMKGYTVFNVAQIEGLPDRYYAAPTPTASFERIARCERFFDATGAKIHHGGSSAYFAPGPDRIQMPLFESFRDVESYYAVLAHETTHWTGHASRLNREFGRKRWGDEGYAMEELVAELGAAFLAATLELTPEFRIDHVSYIDNWLTVLKRDKRAIFTAASHAQRAVDFLIGLQSGRTGAEAPPR
jgi:antirestriction protein ArdC